VEEFTSIEQLENALLRASYLPDRGLATALFLALRVRKPLLLEGEAGVGKTEAAKAVAATLGSRLIRLQCYEGLDVAHAVYEWNYTRQLLHIRATQDAGAVEEDELFGERFLVRRPLLEAISSPERVVLLIDEIDRADDEFEAFLLEMLSDFQITIPEIGTISAQQRPVVVDQTPVLIDHLDRYNPPRRCQRNCRVRGHILSYSRRRAAHASYSAGAMSSSLQRLMSVIIACR